LDNQQVLVILPAQRNTCIFIQLLVDTVDIPSRVLQLLPDSFSDLLSGLLFLLRYPQVLLSGCLPVCSRLRVVSDTWR
jgi:hypothetical protein